MIIIIIIIIIVIIIKCSQNENNNYDNYCNDNQNDDGYCVLTTARHKNIATKSCNLSKNYEDNSREPHR